MKIKVVKFKLYPEVDPVGYIVGFNIALENGRSFYIHTVVSLDQLAESKTDEEIVQVAYEQVSEQIAGKVSVLVGVPSLEGLEINVNGEYETRAINIDSRVSNIESTIDIILGDTIL